MGGLAHYLEREGLATVNIALVYKHAAIAQPSPRALWVPFWYGRPLGAPNEPLLQRRVLDATMALLDEPGDRLLKEFSEDAPAAVGALEWRPPFDLPRVEEESDRKALADALREEVAIVAARHEEAKAGRNSSFVGLSGLSLMGVADLLVDFLHAREETITSTRRPGLALKFGAQELIDAYAECVIAAGGADSPFGFRRWYWHETTAGLTVRHVADIAKVSPDHRARMIARHGSLLPREWNFVPGP
ncbi:MAG: hypothetical protein OXU19_09590 [bacterium]|nr:hypothetical protein [bacterium]MDE0241547.1 hypothetical protein [bacterium]MDE0415987.1 hypothetical protein [bacterium]